jgi:predicted nuclease of predicted toxin-antitoxin system
MKLILDMNLSPDWVAVLNRAGHEAVHWSTLGPHNTPDTAIMAYAAANDYVVMTHDLDFGTILAITQGNKPSVIQIRADNINPTAIGSLVIRALEQLADDLAAGALVTIDPHRARLSILPLQTRK